MEGPLSKIVGLGESPLGQSANVAFSDITEPMANSSCKGQDHLEECLGLSRLSFYSSGAELNFFGDKGAERHPCAWYLRVNSPVIESNVARSKVCHWRYGESANRPERGWQFSYMVKDALFSRLLPLLFQVFNLEWVWRASLWLTVQKVRHHILSLLSICS